MIAYRLIAPQQPPLFQDVPKPSAKSGQLLIKVGGCGLCHTDLGTVRHRTKEEWGDRQPPFTMGHEIAGWVAEVGEGVVGFKEGEGVAVVPLWGSCATIVPLPAAAENFCYFVTRMMGAGMGFDGGLAEYMATPIALAVDIGEFDPITRRAPDGFAGPDAYTAIKPALPSLVPGSTPQW